MKHYTVEADKTPIAVFVDQDDEEANWFIEGETNEGQAFRADLLSLVDARNSQPLWDGEENSLRIRHASRDEVDSWDRSRESSEDEDWVCFLVPVADPTDDD